MANDELTPAEALRALADGETLTDVDGATCKLENDLIAARNKGGEMLGEFWLSMANWRRIPKRDVGADPKVGDVLVLGDSEASAEVITVLHVTDKYLLLEGRIGGCTYPQSCTREGWADWCNGAQATVRAKEKVNG